VEVEIMTTATELPFPDSCRTMLVTRDLYECHAPEAPVCTYALPFGTTYYCKHNNRHKVVVRK